MAFTVGILGAGISGLSCAQALRTKGVDVTVLEKSKSLGGRCATRCWNGHVVDHGAQFLTLRNDRFKVEMETLLGSDLKSLRAPVVNFKGETLASSEGDGRFYHVGGNNRIGQQLAQGLQLRQEVLVEHIRSDHNKIWAADFGFDSLVISLPIPQTAQLLGWKASPVRYAPCLTLLFEYEGEWAGNSPDRYALSDLSGSENLAWSACENHKVGRIKEGSTVFVVQASEAFSQQHIEDDLENYLPLLRADLEKQWKLSGVKLKETFLHRWLYARPVEGGIFPELPRGIYLCGDGVSKGRIEEVWLSGVAAAEKILKEI